MRHDDDDENEFDFASDDELDNLLVNRTLNKEIRVTTVRHAIPLQRTLTGERLDPNAETHYEEIQREVTFHATHHEMNRENLSTYIYPSNLELRDYQYDIIRKALFKNILCAIPTGLGKTFIASTLMLNYYRWFKKEKIIFMAPTRPLVAQQIQACLGCTNIPSSETAILLDKSRKNRPEIWADKRVFFTTPQVVENDLKAGILNPKEVVCLVIDEAHRATGNYAYTNVVKFIERFNPSFRVLALTATPASDIEGVQAVVDNLSISQIEIRTEESIDIVKYMKKKETVRIKVDVNTEMDDIVALLSIAIEPVLKQANEANIYEITDPSRINFFAVQQKSQSIVRNPSLNEGVKWKYFFILQLLGYVGQMLRRLRIYGVRTFYSYFQNKSKEFQTKYDLGKSTNRTAASFFYHNSLKSIKDLCETVLEDPKYVSHPKLEHLLVELGDFFQEKQNSKVIVFTELRESALEIVKCIDSHFGDKYKAHIFIGQSKAKEGFDEDEYKQKHSAKGRGKKKREERMEKEMELQKEKERQRQADNEERANSRTGTSEKAQLQGMNQKMQKELIKKFKNGDIDVLVATSIGEEGLDIGEVDLIICYDSTSSPIKNIQRMGRTGRKNDGKVILLLAGSEELKFDQSMEEYSKVQKQIASNNLNLHKSDRIIPKDIVPSCEKQFIEIPEENLVIAKGEDEDQVIRYATQAMLGQNLPRSKPSKVTKRKKTFETSAPPTKKRFFMPDSVETGFVKSSNLVKKINSKVAEGNSSNTSILLDSDGNESEVDITGNTDGPSTSFSKNVSKSWSRSRNSSFYMPDSDNNSIKKVITDTSNLNLLNGIFENDFEENDDLTEKERQELDELGDIEDQFGTREPSVNRTVSFLSNIQVEDDTRLEELKNKDIISDIQANSSVEIDHIKHNSRNLENKESKEKESNRTERSHSNQAVELIGSSDEAKKTNKVLFEGELDEVMDSEQEDEDTNQDIFADVLEKLKTLKNSQASQTHDLVKYDETQPSSLANKVLSFSAFEIENSSENEEDPLDSQYLKATEFMEKQYDADKSYEITQDSREISQVEVKKPQNSNFSITNPPPQSEKKNDITYLLKRNSNSNKKLVSRRRVDLSTISESQIIKLDDDPQPIKSHRQYKIKEDKFLNNPFIYMSEKDNVFKTTFEEREGFLTNDESKIFFSEYYSTAATDSVDPDPTISAKSDIKGRINHSGRSKRFIKFIHILCSKEGVRLSRLQKKLEEDSKLNYDNNIKSTDIIVDRYYKKVEDDQSNDEKDSRMTEIEPEIVMSFDDRLKIESQTRLNRKSGKLEDITFSDDDEDFMAL
ncbi:hypothetical protein WICMUC_004963 [Wickerhamomyces mucosus]|uniref:ATP-dependent DNA helicase n=1 Tax=Wickerhamomyces mucosus TaxID=1378264 RepID=A0A9P8T859_9ASCO|nr:hypothetical protein WICMUC_004963 [Wickerhamomyces mucosus]